jgi:hypothetical protein
MQTYPRPFSDLSRDLNCEFPLGASRPPLPKSISLAEYRGLTARSLMKLKGPRPTPLQTIKAPGPQLFCLHLKCSQHFTSAVRRRDVNLPQLSRFLSASCRLCVTKIPGRPARKGGGVKKKNLNEKRKKGSAQAPTKCRQSVALVWRWRRRRRRWSRCCETMRDCE